MPAFKDLTGKRFGRLLIIRRIGVTAQRHALWETICDCGTIKSYTTSNLNQVKSCGCLHKEVLARGAGLKHGKSNTKLYLVWSNMKARCHNPNNPQYCDYGALGISIDLKWINDFSTFENWALNNGYKEGLYIGRIDNNGNYEPDNCQFVTSVESNKNKRKFNLKRVNWLTAFGETKTTMQWVDDERCKAHQTLRERLRHGWLVEKAIITPPRVYQRGSK